MKFHLKHIRKSRFGLATHKTLDPLPLPKTRQKDLTDAFCDGFRVLSNVQKADVYHRSYAYYLMTCWANHYGAVISAEMLWFSAMPTFARLVQKDPEAFRSFFVDFPDRKEIAFVGESDETSVFKFIELALPLIKLDLMPEFSTSTKLSRLATGVAFCDAVSPYVYGMILGCGIPSVTVIDSLDDWKTLQSYTAKLSKALASTKAGPFFDRISKRAQEVQNAILSNDPCVFQNMFELANCSSGHPVYEFSGWIVEFFSLKKSALIETAGENCAKAIFKRSDGPDLGFFCGIFGSNYDAAKNMLIPHFDRIIAEAANGDQGKPQN